MGEYADDMGELAVATAMPTEESELQRVTRELEGLKIAMRTRAVIEQAKGVIMSATHCDADHAFDLLRLQSQAENRKLSQIASEIVTTVARRAP